MKYIKIFLLTLFAASITACEEFVELEPFDQISNDIVLVTPDDAEALVLGAYSDGLQDADSYGELEISMTGLLSDELTHTGSFPAYSELNRNQVSTGNGNPLDYWDAMYEGLFLANFLIENIEAVEEITPEERDQYVGEARWLRAIFHFNLVKYFGAVPIANTSDLPTLEVLERSPVPQVYSFIIEDLQQAITLLEGVEYATAEESKSRATEWAAKALLARVQLYNGNLTEAGNLANDVIENGPFELAGSYSDIFSGNSPETIFEVYADPNDGNSLAFFFQEDGRYEYAPSEAHIAKYEEGDLRLSVVGETSGGRPMATKYTDVQNGTDQPIVLRLSEMYLIRAEARQGTAQADSDLNLLRERAGLAPLSGSTLDDILQERAVELAFEGHRWHDLVRTGRAGDVMSAINPSTWDATDVLLPIPQNELDLNSNLTQNPGYGTSE